MLLERVNTRTLLSRLSLSSQLVKSKQKKHVRLFWKSLAVASFEFLFGSFQHTPTPSFIAKHREREREREKSDLLKVCMMELLAE